LIEKLANTDKILTSIFGNVIKIEASSVTLYLAPKCWILLEKIMLIYMINNFSVFNDYKRHYHAQIELAISLNN
jgi:preprotein translocase subunit YajC